MNSVPKDPKLKRDEGRMNQELEENGILTQELALYFPMHFKYQLLRGILFLWFPACCISPKGSKWFIARFPTVCETMHAYVCEKEREREREYAGVHMCVCM